MIATVRCSGPVCNPHLEMVCEAHAEIARADYREREDHAKLEERLAELRSDKAKGLAE